MDAQSPSAHSSGRSLTRIARESDMVVCGEADDLAEALRLTAATKPDAAVIDVDLKSGSGIDLIELLKARHDSLAIVVWSMYSEDLYAERALRAGAQAYVNKQAATATIIEALRHVLQGKVYLSKGMTDKLLQWHVGRSARQSTQVPLDVLSNREADVLRLIGQGTKTASIAKKLSLSVKTVETYRDRIRHKLNLNDGAELTRYTTLWALSTAPAGRLERGTPM